jgi:hypothetical protein
VGSGGGRPEPGASADALAPSKIDRQ